MRLSELTDEDLALRARREPQAAFEVLFERYRGPLYSFLLRQGAEASRADDLFQTTFLKAFRALPGFREEARFKTWFYAIAVNVLNDELRAARRRGREERLESRVVEGAEPRDPLEQAEALERVKAALRDLPAHHRQLFTLVRFQGLSIAEAARAAGLTPAAAKVTLFRVHKKVGERLAPAREKKS